MFNVANNADNDVVNRQVTIAREAITQLMADDSLEVFDNFRIDRIDRTDRID